MTKPSYLLEEYAIWEESGPYEFFENSTENWLKVQSMDNNHVWTAHSTCEDEQLTPGAHLFAGSCCWDTFGWYVGEKAWEDETAYVQTSAYLPCPDCNPDGEDEEGSPDCQVCDGTAYYNFYVD